VFLGARRCIDEVRVRPGRRGDDHRVNGWICKQRSNIAGSGAAGVAREPLGGGNVDVADTDEARSWDGARGVTRVHRADTACAEHRQADGRRRH
jgi:hypothetical protein